MPSISNLFAIPQELMGYVDRGVLEVLSEKPGEKSVTFHLPHSAHTDPEGYLTSYILKWIHPAFNSEFCDYYDETPGDLPNFLLVKEREGQPDRRFDFESLDELTGWLEDLPVGHP